MLTGVLQHPRCKEFSNFGPEMMQEPLHGPGTRREGGSAASKHI